MMANILESCTGYFCSAGFSFLLQNATGNSREPFVDACCNRTALMAQSDASVSSTKGQSSWGSYKTGAVVNAVFNAINVCFRRVLGYYPLLDCVEEELGRMCVYP